MGSVSVHVCVIMCLCLSLLLKVCNTLKSRLTDVREAGRDTLLKMAQSLGSKFICYIFSELTASLTRGYQVTMINACSDTINWF